MENKEVFNYTYSAKEQKEIDAIRKKYLAPEEDKMEQLRRLDSSVSKKATAVSVGAGVVGALIMGLGMSLAMSELPQILGLYKNMAIVAGVLIGALGIAICSCAYPLYNRIIKKERERIAPEIIRLTDELMK